MNRMKKNGISLIAAALLLTGLTACKAKTPQDLASECWLMERYSKRLQVLTGSKVLSAVVWIVCFTIHLGIVYFFGRVVGEILPFST